MDNERNFRHLIRIICVDDDYDESFLFAEALQRLGIRHKLYIANKCEELIHLLKAKPEIDVIFLDINMPGQDGKACLREVKSNNEWSKIPVVILTGTYNKPDADEVYSLGANLYVIKPVVHRDFVSMMQSLFSYDWQKDPKPRFRKFVIEHMSDVGT